MPLKTNNVFYAVCVSQLEHWLLLIMYSVKKNVTNKATLVFDIIPKTSGSCHFLYRCYSNSMK